MGIFNWFGKKQKIEIILKESSKLKINKKLEKLKIKKVVQKEIKKQRRFVAKIKKNISHKKKIKKDNKDFVKTGITGLDNLLGKGIPKGTSIIIAGGPGSGKTIMGLQIAQHAAKNREKVLYLSLEENPDRLREHMGDFGWNPKILEKKGLLTIKRVDPFSISRSVEALLAKAKGELMINLEGIGSLIPRRFKPRWVILDSITALESAFKDEEDNYRIYIQQLFRYFEKMGANLFLISETGNIPQTYSKTGVEEFLADGVIVLYHIKKGNIRERAIEVLKLRGAAHQDKIVAMQIKTGKGIEVYPEQEIFSKIE